MDEDYSLNPTMLTAREAANLSTALQYIRRGRLDRALEALEMSLDVCVVALSSLSKSAKTLRAEEPLRALRSIRDYRRRYPRRTETDLSRMKKDAVSGALDLQERARRILEGIE